MALIKTTAIVDAISGKLNGTVFSRNKGGAYVRSRSTVLNPKTLPQQSVRAIFGSISQAWRDLTPEEQQAWINATPNYPYQNALGDAKQYTGKALFQKLNQNLLGIGVSMRTAPAAPQDVIGIASWPTKLSIDINGDVMNFTGDLAQALEAGQSFVLEATPPLSTGVTNASNQFRKVATASLAASATSITASDFDQGPTTLYDLYTDTLGAPVEGAKIFVRIKPINPQTGQDGPYASQSTVVVDSTP